MVLSYGFVIVVWQHQAADTQIALLDNTLRTFAHHNLCRYALTSFCRVLAASSNTSSAL